MYRIRKDIDLKELEKFGYRLVKDDGYHKAYIKDLKDNDYIAIFGDGTILIDVKDFCGDNFEELQNDIKDNNATINISSNENINKEENKPIVEDKKEVLKVQDKLEEKIDNNVKDEVHITKQDYLNRLNALKNKK